MSGRQAEDKSGNRGRTARNDGFDSLDGGSTLPVPDLFPKTESTSTGTGNSTGKGKATVPAPQGTNALKDWKDFFAPVEEDTGCKDGVCPVPWAKPVFVDMETPIDLVNHPPHYASGAIECIEAIEAQLTPEEYRGYLKGNCVKYQWRERQKGGVESLKKAQWYLNRLIALDESAQKG
jgi:hypothetical protein